MDIGTPIHVLIHVHFFGNLCVSLALIGNSGVIM